MRPPPSRVTPLLSDPHSQTAAPNSVWRLQDGTRLGQGWAAGPGWQKATRAPLGRQKVLGVPRRWHSLPGKPLANLE